jgi:hypothetical protein
VVFGSAIGSWIEQALWMAGFLVLACISFSLFGFIWSFFEVSDVSVGLSLFMVLVFLSACMLVVWWMFRTGYRLKQ